MPNRSLLACALLALCGFARQEESPRILRPVDGCILEAGSISVIAKAAGNGELRLDGKTVRATRPAAGVLTAVLELSPGKHELVLVSDGGEQRIRFQTGANPAPPPDWKPYRIHPPAADCDACHAVRDGAWNLIGEVAGPGCLTCHDSTSFADVHTHSPGEMDDCALCHDPHGSTAKRHLIMPKTFACTQCHE